MKWFTLAGVSKRHKLTCSKGARDTVREGQMAVVVVSRWKGNPQDMRILREGAPNLKRHGAVSVRATAIRKGASMSAKETDRAAS